MRPVTAFACSFLIVAALSGCTRLGAGTSSSGSMAGATIASTSARVNSGMVASTPAANTSAALSSTDVVAFIDPSAVPLLSAKEKAEAASAQFYALQFGRPGAPRQWQGDAGASGKVQVGPYIRVNQLDCRDFTHVVTTKQGDFTRTGTACRETDGQWNVVQSS